MSNDFSRINALDPNTLNGLKRLSRDQSPEAIREASRQFEALFMQQVMKSMREASPKGGMLDTEETRSYQTLLDQQMMLQLSSQGQGVGLAKVIERQLGGGLKGNANPASLPVAAPTAGLELGVGAGEVQSDPAVVLDNTIRQGFEQVAARAARMAEAARAAAAATAKTAAPAAATSVPGSIPGMPNNPGAQAFVQRIWPEAEAASRATGIPARFLVAQAALETGWGKKELRNADGSPSFNLFNIKAGRSWNGASVTTNTTEYRNGVAQREDANFRAYGSYQEAFQDYARLISTSPRYARVVGTTDANAFARGLQAAGYATDPMYADKLARIINGNTLRTALANSGRPLA
jgi:peptidoglycan hydrolase FlgJ